MGELWESLVVDVRVSIRIRDRIGIYLSRVRVKVGLGSRLG